MAAVSNITFVPEGTVRSNDRAGDSGTQELSEFLKRRDGFTVPVGGRNDSFNPLYKPRPENTNGDTDFTVPVDMSNLAAINNFTFTPEGKTLSNDSMNVGASARLDSNRSTEGPSAFLTGRLTGRIKGRNDSYEAFDKLFPPTGEWGVGTSLPVGSGKLEVSSGIRNMTDTNESTSSTNITYNHNNGHYAGGYSGGDGYKGIYGGYQVSPDMSISGNINADPSNRVTSALIQLRRTL
jgi:hypothetical protein